MVVDAATGELVAAFGSGTVAARVRPGSVPGHARWADGSLRKQPHEAWADFEVREARAAAVEAEAAVRREAEAAAQAVLAERRARPAAGAAPS